MTVPIETFIPHIDDRRFDDIMAEVRTRIARYTPEWTDFNDNEPGITMVQVFAWMTELLTYRMAKVPELNYLKFLQLIGIELSPAEPASAEITFPVVAKFKDPIVLVPRRTQVSAESPDGGPPVVFETERALTALTATLGSVQSYDGFEYLDATPQNTAAVEGFQPFGPLANDDSALLLGFDYDGLAPAAFPARTEIDLAVTVFQDTRKSPAIQCGLPDTAVFGPAQVRWEYWDGTEWKSLNLLKDETYAFTRSGHIFLKTPPSDTALQLLLLPAPGESKKRYWIRAHLVRSQYERPPRLLAIRTNTVQARQAETIQDEVLGGSNGRPNQPFRLENTPVLHDSVKLEVDEGSGPEIWTMVDDLFGSGADDPHYTLNRTTGDILFGDGVNGRIPVANVDNPGSNVIAREYRFGGGSRGNVPPGSLKTVVTAVDGLDESRVGNLLASFGWRNEESLLEAKKRAPRSLRSRCRAVTADDYETLAKQAANIKRAKALPLFHPAFPGVDVPGVITVIVVPEADEKTPNPTPSEGTLQTVCAYLEQKRLLTTELYVIRPTYQKVEIRGDVVVNDDADLAEVKDAIEKTLLTYFHPLTGGEDGEGWPFGGTIYYSRVYQRVFTIAGVKSIEDLIVVLDGEPKEICKDVPITRDALLFSTEHNVQVGYQFNS